MFSDVLWLPKRGNTPEQFDDAYALNHKEQRYAIADGVTDSYDPGRWARLLVQDFVDFSWPSLEELPAYLEPLGQTWQKEIFQEELPWYKHQKAELGASSTFLGIWIDPVLQPSSASGTWAAAAIGDSCVLQLRAGDLLPESLFPMRHRDEFSFRPAQINSDPSRYTRAFERLEFHIGEYQSGDVFLLATDAIAQFLIGEWEEGGRPWELFRGNSQEQFQENINMLRDQKRMRNDDVTLMILEIDSVDADIVEVCGEG